MESNTRLYSASLTGLSTGADTNDMPSFWATACVALPPSTVKIPSGRNINNMDELGYSFRKYLKALTPDFNSSINADARDVAARPRKVRYNSEPNWISGYGYNRNCARSCFETEG